MQSNRTGSAISTDPTSRYLRTKQLAAWISVSPRVVRYWMKKGVIPYLKVGKVVLFKRDAVEVALDRFKVEAVTGASARVNRKRKILRFDAVVQT